ncbi:MAG: MotA/TolQ/ExbB proton channel family protein [Parachlamydiaceae bacterium]|nr:MotA/TolQ/ExbB proton channel family protein [Parachlamydiaceae bacterium]
MYVNSFFYSSLATNPFFDAYLQSDVLGKMIFLGLFALSIFSWILIIYKGWLVHRARKYSIQFYEAFELQRSNPLSLECENSARRKQPNPFLDLYSILKKHTIEILNKNRRFGQQNQQENQTESAALSYLSPADIDIVEAHLMSNMANQTKYLEKNLFYLSTIVSLAPFLGLLGTVWGILTTFSELQTQGGGGTHQMVLGGISLALATTVLGLIDAIPALIGYNYLRNSINDFQIEMDGFSNEILASVEMQYRKVDVL